MVPPKRKAILQEHFVNCLRTIHPLVRVFTLLGRKFCSGMLFFIGLVSPHKEFRSWNSEQIINTKLKACYLDLDVRTLFVSEQRSVVTLRMMRIRPAITIFCFSAYLNYSKSKR